MEHIKCPTCESFNIKNFGRRRTIKTQQNKYILFCLDCGHSFSLDELNDYPIKEKIKEINYKQDWTAYNLAKTKEKTLFLEILSELLNQIPYTPQKKVGKPSMNLKEIIFCNAIKAYDNHSARRVIADIKLCNAKGYINWEWHFNTILKGLNKQELTGLLKQLILLSALPLKEIEDQFGSQFAVDSTGFSNKIYSSWHHTKWETKEKHAGWLKAHIIIGTKTNTVTDVKVTLGTANDSPLLPELVFRTSAYFNVLEVSADKGYLSETNLQAIESIGATPFIPFKSLNKNTTSKSGIWKKMFKLYFFNSEQFKEHYHRRSNVESTFSAIKGKFGGSLKSKSFVGQTNEVLLKVLCHNICCLIQEMYETGVDGLVAQEISNFCTQTLATAHKLQKY
ncbi:MAG: transposase [archaeon]